MSDKILVSNSAALTSKYGADGVKTIKTAVNDLIASDKDRGLVTQMVDISDKATMKKFGGAAVTASQSGRQTKAAIDAIYASAQPDYIVILDCDDVIPHIDLNNPASEDGDATVPSDLPYASDAPFTNRDIATYSAVTRVVGRIAGIRGATTPDFLVNQLKNAAKRPENAPTTFLISAYRRSRGRNRLPRASTTSSATAPSKSARRREVRTLPKCWCRSRTSSIAMVARSIRNSTGSMGTIIRFP